MKVEQKEVNPLEEKEPPPEVTREFLIGMERVNKTLTAEYERQQSEAAAKGKTPGGIKREREGGASVAGEVQEQQKQKKRKRKRKQKKHRNVHPLTQGELVVVMGSKPWDLASLVREFKVSSVELVCMRCA